MSGRGVVPLSKEAVTKELRSVRDKIVRLEMELHIARRLRDDLALELIQEHTLTWRETAELAGFENPYIARILRRARSA